MYKKKDNDEKPPKVFEKLYKRQNKKNNLDLSLEMKPLKYYNFIKNLKLFKII